MHASAERLCPVSLARTGYGDVRACVEQKFHAVGLSMTQDHSAAHLAKLPEHGFDSRDVIRCKQIDLDTVGSENLNLEEGAGISVHRLGRAQ